jgi:uncharacterized protein
MDINPQEIKITHKKTEGRFETLIDGQVSRLEYALDGDTIVMLHVGVYPGHRGQGVAARLTETALKYAKEESLRVLPMCSYVAAYIRGHPQYLSLTKPKGS